MLEAPHFVLYVQQELERRYGPDALVRGGWQVTTSLDLNIHSMAETAAREQVAARAGRPRRQQCVCGDPQTGHRRDFGDGGQPRLF